MKFKCVSAFSPAVGVYLGERFLSGRPKQICSLLLPTAFWTSVGKVKLVTCGS